MSLNEVMSIYFYRKIVLHGKNLTLYQPFWNRAHAALRFSYSQMRLSLKLIVQHSMFGDTFKTVCFKRLYSEIKYQHCTHLTTDFIRTQETTLYIFKTSCEWVLEEIYQLITSTNIILKVRLVHFQRLML
jgi:hypothetical protein